MIRVNNSGENIDIGIVGIGLMGSSIIASLLAAGHTVKAIAPLRGEIAAGTERIREQLMLCRRFGLLSASPDACLKALTVTGNYEELHSCRLVLECVIEDIGIKADVYANIAAAVAPAAIIASNTSAIPISILQQHVPHPERFIGIHWAEPAYGTRFLEIVCGELTADKTANYVLQLARKWGKEPTLLKKDIRGFITNRLMYALYREMLTLLEKKDATLEDMDKASRYDAGSWMTFMGIFRRMDFMGLEDYPVIFERIFPTLNNGESIPPMMQQYIDQQSKGVQNGKGFYQYTREEARAWIDAFAAFNIDIHQLANGYPADLNGKRIQ